MATEAKTDTTEKTDEEWQVQLPPEQYAVTRHHATERPFSGEYDKCNDPGVYKCICCGQPLFDSETKFNSGTGWPSFYQPIEEKAVGTTVDTSLFMTRTEVHCSRCDAHLGHIFPDGPRPTGQRYCINSVSLDLERAPED